VRPEEHLPPERLVVPDDDRLAATEIETGDGVLVRHPAREAQGVDDGFLVARVPPEARAPERGTERRAVNRDHPAVSRRVIVTEDDLLVPHGGDGVKQFHVREWLGD
jgi:hypothetical protein